MKPTPGPLEYSRHATPNYVPQFGIYAGNKGIATVMGDNAEADTKRFAASPELQSALEDCIGVLDSVNREFAGRSVAVRAVLDKARDALAKATTYP